MVMFGLVEDKNQKAETENCFNYFKLLKVHYFHKRDHTFYISDENVGK